MEKKYQVFISSTYKDLVEERFEVMQTLLTFGCMPAGMELFPAANDSQWNFIKKIIDESDYYLIIVGGKYGSIHPETGISYTRMEYEYATSIKKPILRFLVENLDSLPQDKIEKDPKIYKKLVEFRKLLTINNLCRFYENPNRLALQVSLSIKQLIESHPATGWIPANQLDRLAEKAEEVVDFDELKSQLEKIVIYKMLNLKTIEETQPVIYEKYIPRLKKKIKVSSEFMATKINRFEKKVNHFKSRDRTNGDAIEVNSFLPFKLRLEDGDRKATLIEPVIAGPSNVYVLSGHIYNGFKNGELDLGIKAEKNTKTARLIVDLSSIPGIEDIITKPPRLFYNRFSEDSNIMSIENMEDVELFNYDTIAPGIFCAEIHDIRKEEGLRFEFSVDIDNSTTTT
jgi:hypothetical protein